MGVSVDYKDTSIALSEMLADPVLTQKAVESYELMKQRFSLVTRRMLNKSGRAVGDLAGAWQGVIFEPARDGRVSFGVINPLPYANIHNTGKPVIKPKKKFLAIPLTDAAHNQGWPRDWQGPKLKFGISKAGNAVLFLPDEKVNGKAKRHARKKKRRRNTANQKPGVYGKPQYALKTSVKLKATGYIDVATKESMDLINDEGIW